MSDSYNRLSWYLKADRVADCGSKLDWSPKSGAVQDESVPRESNAARNGLASSSTFKLVHANFCRDRLCPMCSWRRSYKIFGQMSQIMNYIGDNYRFIFLTLTVPSCKPEELNGLIDDMMNAWGKLIRRKRFKGAVKGFFRALEITRNKNNNTYHPHFHVVLAVNNSYFVSRDYIKRDEWLRMWQQSMKDDSITQVDIRVMMNKFTGETSGQALNSAVAEVSKYAVKSADYIFEGNNNLMDNIIFTLSSALAYRRLTALGGVFKEAQSKLCLDDCEDGDLVHLDNKLREDVATMIFRYQWSAGVYKLVKIIKLEIVDGVSVNPETGEVIP